MERRRLRRGCCLRTRGEVIARRMALQKCESFTIGLAVEVLVQSIDENWLLADVPEQGYAGVEFEIIGKLEDGFDQLSDLEAMVHPE